MKKFLIFVLGLVIGGLLVYCFFPNTVKSQKVDAEKEEQPGAQPVAQPEESGYAHGKNYFETAVEYAGRQSFQVKKVLEDGDAFAEEVIHVSSGVVVTDYGTNVLLEYNPEMPYYDSQLVQAAEGKKVLQMGIYRYKESKYSDTKTIPIIAIR